MHKQHPQHNNFMTHPAWHPNAGKNTRIHAFPAYGLNSFVYTDQVIIVSWQLYCPAARIAGYPCPQPHFRRQVTSSQPLVSSFDRTVIAYRRSETRKTCYIDAKNHVKTVTSIPFSIARSPSALSLFMGVYYHLYPSPKPLRRQRFDFTRMSQLFHLSNLGE